MFDSVRFIKSASYVRPLKVCLVLKQNIFLAFFISVTELTGMGFLNQNSMRKVKVLTMNEQMSILQIASLIQHLRWARKINSYKCN